MAVERDADFTLAYAHAAWCYTSRKTNGWMDNPTQETAEAERLAKRALELGRDDAAALCFGGITLGYVVGHVEDGAALVGRALVSSEFGCRLVRKRLVETMPWRSRRRDWRLDPWHASESSWFNKLRMADRHRDGAFLRRPVQRGRSVAEEALRDQPSYAYAFRALAATHAMSGRSSDAQRAMARLREAIRNFG